MDRSHTLPANLSGILSPTGHARRNAVIFIANSMAAAATCLANDRASDHADHKIAKSLRAGGCVMLLRHAATEPGVGDPAGFTLNDCRTQRNLSAAGQQDARRIGAWFERHKLVPRAVRSSAWCRCKDTAELAFGKHQVWPALNSTFGDRVQQPDSTGLLRQSLARIPVRQFDVWVTHQVNVSAFTGEWLGMGEALMVDKDGNAVGRIAFG